MKNIRFACPICAQRLSCDISMEGTEIACPKCQGKVVVPRGEVAENIAFSCPSCGQHLNCDANMQGREIVCPPCKAAVIVPTSKVCAAYSLLDLRPGLRLAEVTRAHREQVRVSESVEKIGALNLALEDITAYLVSQPTPSSSSPQGKPPPEKKAAPLEKAAESKASPPSSARPASSESPARFPLRPILIGLAVTLILALLTGLALVLFRGKPPPLTAETTGAAWLQADQRTRLAYCRAVLVKLEQQGVLRKYRVRANDQIVYEALESVLRQQRAEDVNTNLVDLCARLIADGHPGFQ